MKTATPEDIAFLKRIRGRFGDSYRASWSVTLYACLLGICLPLLFSFALLHDGIPVWPLNSDQWTLVILIPATIFLGWFLWSHLGGEYEFTDLGIILWHRHQKRREMRFDEIEKTDLKTDRYGNSSLILEGNGRRFPILLYPSLKAQIHKTTTEQDAP